MVIAALSGWSVREVLVNAGYQKIAHNESVFAMAGYSVFRHAGTKVDFCFIVEDNICRLITNVKPVRRGGD